MTVMVLVVLSGARVIKLFFNFIIFSFSLTLANVLNTGRVVLSQTILKTMGIDVINAKVLFSCRHPILPRTEENHFVINIAHLRQLNNYAMEHVSLIEMKHAKNILRQYY